MILAHRHVLVVAARPDPGRPTVLAGGVQRRELDGSPEPVPAVLRQDQRPLDLCRPGRVGRQSSSPCGASASTSPLSTPTSARSPARDAVDVVEIAYAVGRRSGGRHRRVPGRARRRSRSWRGGSRGAAQSPRRARRSRPSSVGRHWATKRFTSGRAPSSTDRARRIPTPCRWARGWTATSTQQVSGVSWAVWAEAMPTRSEPSKAPTRWRCQPLWARQAAMRASSPIGTHPGRTWLVAADSTAYAAASSASSQRSRGRTDTAMLMRPLSQRVATLDGWRTASSRRPSRRSIRTT